MSEAPTALVSVVIPTYHRPDDLRRAVMSLLAQELPDGTDMEVLIGLSDAAAADDRAMAEELAQADSRVRFATAGRLGPAAARNAALSLARGEALAFLDDDCEAQPGWLAVGLGALDDADIVQGRTEPLGVPGYYDHAIRVEALSWLWETCNLFVRRAAADRAGSFDEDWNPTGRPGDHWGEDAVWAWEVVRRGARIAFAPDALVLHANKPRDYSSWLRYVATQRYYPLLIRRAPEVRQRLYKGYFLSRRHVTLTAATSLLALGLVARTAGQPIPAYGMLALATLGYLSPLTRGAGLELFRNQLPKDVIEFSAAIYGSIRYRRVVL